MMCTRAKMKLVGKMKIIDAADLMELTVTNRSRAYPGRSSEDSKVDEVQYVVLKVCVSRPGRDVWSFYFARTTS